MKKHTILYYDLLNFHHENLKLLGQYFEVYSLSNPEAASDEILKKVDAIFAPLGYSMDAAMIDRCSQLKTILSNTTGIAHIDTTAAEKRDIYISALHDDQEFLKEITPTAEHAFGLIIALHRRLIEVNANALLGNWNRFPWGTPQMLSRMTIGLVGYGRLGRMVAKMADAFKMEVYFYDPDVDGGEKNIQELAKKSQILSIHSSVTKNNYHLIDKEVLFLLPAESLVINTARGELLDTNALLDLLESGHLRGAALDVIEGEFEPGFVDKHRSSRILDYARNRSNLILSQHIGGSTNDAWYLTQRRVIEKAVQHINKKEQV